MIVDSEKLGLHCCDLCKRRIRQTNIYKCSFCKKEVCGYCRVSLSRTERKDPYSGYFLRKEIVCQLCLDCANEKLGLKLTVRYLDESEI